MPELLSKQSEVQEQLLKLYHLCSKGNEQAFKFLIAWQHYCHNIDDDIDGEAHMKLPANKVANYVTAYAIYSSGYWQQHISELAILIPLISTDYIDSNSDKINAYSKDFLRSNGNLMIKAVAFIEGGWDLLRQVSPIVANLSFSEHHEVIKGI